jgi:hypothetical protein
MKAIHSELFIAKELATIIVSQAEKVGMFCSGKQGGK